MPKILSNQQRGARRRRQRERRITMLCRRLDRLVEAGERLRRGKTRAMFLHRAEITRHQLFKIDH